MKRVKNKARSVEFANSLIRPNPFHLGRRPKLNDGPEHYRYHYGDSIITIHGGQLFEEERATLLRLTELQADNDGRPIRFEMYDLAKGRGLKNPYQESSLAPIRESFENLLDFHIRIKPVGKRGFTAAFKLVTGWLDSDDTGFASVSPFLEVIRELATGFTYINPEIYFSIKSQIARSLFVFVSSHADVKSAKAYSIRLSKLLFYLNYDHCDRPWWRVWEYIRNPIEELVQLGLVGKYERDAKRYKQDGGVLTFWKADAPKQITGSTAEQSKEVGKSIREREMNLIRGIFPNAPLSDTELASAVSQLEQFLGPYTVDAEEFLEAYAPFLASKNLSYYSPSLFKPDNVFLREFLSVNQLETRQEKERKEKERADRERQREEEIRKHKAEEKAKWDAMTEEEKQKFYVEVHAKYGVGEDDFCEWP